jgi:hypothetical protein
MTEETSSVSLLCDGASCEIKIVLSLLRLFCLKLCMFYLMVLS